MQHFQEWAQAYWQHYGIVGLPAIWFVLSAVVNTLTRYKSPTELIEILDKIPAGNAALAFVRSFGVDPIALLEAAKVYEERKAAMATAKTAEADKQNPGNQP